MDKWLKEMKASLSEAIEAARIGEILAQNLYMIAPVPVFISRTRQAARL